MSSPTASTNSPPYKGRTSFGGDLFSAGLRATSYLAGRLTSETSLNLRSTSSDQLPGLEMITAHSGAAIEKPGPLVGTLRMGYGHYRFGLTIVDSAIAQGLTPYWHDLTDLPVQRSRILKQVNSMYSRFSRLATEAGEWADQFWEGITSSGNWDALQASVSAAPSFVPLAGDLDRDRPYISTFVWAGHIAAAAGFTKTVHLVNDNAPMPFIIVPGAINLVQSPSMYASMLELGVPADQLEIAGHWVPQTMARETPKNSELRLARISKGLPRRLLLSIGGAGAQLGLTSKILKHLAPHIKDGSCSVFINAGDHHDIFKYLETLIDGLEVPYSHVTNWAEAKKMTKSLRLDNETATEPKGVVLYHMNDTFSAVLLTDLLIPCVDVLITKPSELAFYPVPKLLLHRVGKFERFGAMRASELGGGTPECRNWESTRFYLDELVTRRALLERLNEGILSNSRTGIYDGSIKAVEIAKSLG